MKQRDPRTGELVTTERGPLVSPLGEQGRQLGRKTERSTRSGFSSVPPDDEKTLRDYLEIIFRRIRVVLLVFSLIFAGVLIYTFTRPPVYLSVATLEYQGLRPQGDDLGVRQFTNFFGFQRYLETQAKILKSRELARAVAKEVEPNVPKQPARKSKGVLVRIREALLGPSESNSRPGSSQESDNPLKSLFWRIAGPIWGSPASDSPKPKPLSPEQEKRLRIRALTGTLRGSLSANILQGSNVIRLSMAGRDPALTQLLVEKHIELYLSRNLERIRQDGLEVLSWLREELAKVTDKLMQSERDLVKFVGEHGIISSQDGGFAQVMNMLDRTMASLIASRETRTKLQALSDQRARKNADPYSNAAKNEYVKKLKHSLAAMEAREAEMSGVYSTRYPRRALLRKKIALLKRKIAEVGDQAVSSALDTATREEAALKEVWEGMKKEALRVNALGAEYALLKKKVETNRELHRIILKESKEAEIRTRTAVNNIRTLDPPTSSQIGPRKWNYLFLGFIMASAGGIIAAFIADFLDDSVQNTNTVEQEFDLPRLGIVPDVTKLRRAHRVGRSDAQFEFLAHYRPKSPISDAIRNVQSSIFLSVPGKQVQSMVVSSAVPKEGKTMIAVSLASVLVANTSKKALIVDCDLRKPRIHEVFRCGPNRLGLANLLENGAEGLTIEDVVRSHDIRGLFYMTAGSVPSDPVSLLASARFETIIDELKKRFDFIVLDSPPLLLFPDGRILARHTDGVVLVARQGFVKQTEFRAAAELMATTSGGEILGIVLNRTRKKGLGYTSYGGYYYGRHYDYYSRP